jgi:hypothetical protein
MVAFFLSIVVVGPLASADLGALKGTGWMKQLGHMLLLAEPRLPNAFSGLPYPSLNGSMWTIPYEFRTDRRSWPDRHTAEKIVFWSFVDCSFADLGIFYI